MPFAERLNRPEFLRILIRIGKGNDIHQGATSLWLKEKSLSHNTTGTPPPDVSYFVIMTLADWIPSVTRKLKPVSLGIVVPAQAQHPGQFLTTRPPGVLLGLPNLEIEKTVYPFNHAYREISRRIK